jgi:dipeptidyl-peptidase-4
MVSLALGLMAGAPLMADAPKALTLERIFASPSLNGPTPAQVQLSPDGKWLTSIRPRADDKDRYDLWGIDTRTGEERMLVDSLKLGSGKALSEAEKMQRERARIGNLKGIVHYDWAPDGKSLLVPLDGDLFIATLDGAATKLDNAGAGALNPSISPKGAFVAFVRDQNLVVVDRASGAARPLTTDGKDTLSWGLAEFVAQEEMARTDGYWWSPDDKRLAVARVDESGVEVVTRAAIGADGTTLFNQRYPRAGTNNAKVELYVIASDGSTRIKVDLGANADIYLARVNWAPDGKTLYVQRESRDQKTLDLLAVDPDTGASHVVLTETSPTWLHLQDDFRPLKDGSFLWQSERDGYAHLYHYVKGVPHQLTKGPWMVKRVAGVDEAHGTIFFLANRDDAAAQDLYAVSLKGGVAADRGGLVE